MLQCAPFSPGIKDTRYMNSCCYDLAGYLLLKGMPFHSHCCLLVSTGISSENALFQP